MHAILKGYKCCEKSHKEFNLNQFKIQTNKKTGYSLLWNRSTVECEVTELCSLANKGQEVNCGYASNMCCQKLFNFNCISFDKCNVLNAKGFVGYLLFLEVT
jgi:hypothetical protein